MVIGRLEGKTITIFYSDGDSVSRKDGKSTADNSEYIELDNRIIIPKHRIVRIELNTSKVGGGFHG